MVGYFLSKNKIKNSCFILLHYKRVMCLMVPLSEVFKGFEQELCNSEASSRRTLLAPFTELK